MQKEEMVVLVCLGFFAMIVLTVYFIMKYKAVMPPRANESLLPKGKTDIQKPGIVVLGFGVGLLITGVLNSIYSIENDAINLGIVVVCTGVSMVIANVLDKDNSIEE